MRGEPEQVLEYWRCCSQHNWYSVTYNISYLGTKISCEAARKGTIKDSWMSSTPMIVTNILELFLGYCIFSYQMSKIFCTVLEPNVEFFWKLQLYCCVCLCAFWKTEVNCLCFNYIHLPLDAVFFMTIYSPHILIVSLSDIAAVHCFYFHFCKF